MKKWRALLPGGAEMMFESDSPREYMKNAGYSEYALEQIVSGISDCPVDRGKLRIGLECCRIQTAGLCCNCPYWHEDCDTALMDDALAYITYLEQLYAKADGSD